MCQQSVEYCYYLYNSLYPANIFLKKTRISKELQNGSLICYDNFLFSFPIILIYVLEYSFRVFLCTICVLEYTCCIFLCTIWNRQNQNYTVESLMQAYVPLKQ